MITTIKRIVVLLGITTLLLLAGTGCNTAHGFGKDVTSTGDAIQKGTD
jgi:predicted small secreted protein